MGTAQGRPLTLAPAPTAVSDDTLRLLQYEEMKGLFAPHLASDLGKAALARLRPFTEVERAREALETAREVHGVHARGDRVPLAGCHDLAPLLADVHARGRPLEPEELLRVRETAECAGRAARTIESLAAADGAPPLPRLSALAAGLPGLTVLTDRIAAVVDDRGRVRDDASPRLASVRSEIRVLRDRIERKVADFLGDREVRKCLQEAGARFRSGRVVLAVKAERRGELRGVLHDVSQTGATCFVEPECVVAEGNALEDLLAQEGREITRILWDTTVRVLEFEGPIGEVLTGLGRLELAVAAADAARAEGLVFPALVPGGRLKFRGARHPVLMLLRGRERVVPVDVRLGEDFHVLVITGPNTGGKTVALKTAGLLPLMAQSGMPVPAEEAECSVFGAVHADIGDEQSLQQSLSTFSSHVNRIARFLREAGPESLILLDELGAGTDPAEGAALGRAILDYLHARAARAVVTTHLGALKTFAFTREGVSNASVEFDVETLSPTYRLLIGEPGASNALVIAERLGVPAEVVRQARDLVRPEDLESQEILASAQEIRNRAERHLRDAEGLRSDTRRLRDEAAEALRETEEQRRHVEREAESEMEAALVRLRRLVADFARELGNAPKPFGPKARELEARAAEEVRATPLMKRREEFALSLRRGDEVYVPRLKERFRVHSVRRKERTLKLLRGGLSLEVPFEDVTWVSGRAPGTA